MPIDTTCPHCQANLIGDHIPEKDHIHYSPPYHWGLQVGVEVRGYYDGIAYWQCPECAGKWGPRLKAYERWSSVQ